MFGNKKIVPAGVFALTCCLLAVSTVGATERRLPEKIFRLGVDLEPGFKSGHGIAFQPDWGLVFKIKERVSIIPRFGFQFYEYEDRYWWNEYDYDEYDESGGAINICLTIRYEFCKRLTLENTRFEYDANKREFNHYYFISAFRPYVQTHLGSFTGMGGGVSYYVLPQVGIGIGADFGWNWIALVNDEAGFAVIAPKAVITFCFN